MVQNNRQLVRITLIVVIFAALCGWWFASTFWQIDAAAAFNNPLSEGDGDWVDVMASIADQMLLLFLELASPES